MCVSVYVCARLCISDRHQSIGKFVIIWQNGGKRRAPYVLLRTSPKKNSFGLHWFAFVSRESFQIECHFVQIGDAVEREGLQQVNKWFNHFECMLHSTHCVWTLVFFYAVQLYSKSKSNDTMILYRGKSQFPYTQIALSCFAEENFAAYFHLGSFYI